MYNPYAAFADEPWWDGTYIFRGNGQRYGNKFWGDIGRLDAFSGGEQGGFMYTDRKVVAKTPWVEWDISATQFIRTATKITMTCDFTTELYYHVTGLLEIACGSYNGRNASYNLWHTDSGDDTRFALFHAVDGQPDGGRQEESKVIVIDNEAGGGIHKDGAHVWTDYRAYPGSSYSVWIRRLPYDSLHSFQLRAWFWNYYYYGKNWYYDRSSDPPIGFSSRWVEQRARRISIESDLSWADRVLTVAPATVDGMRLGVSGGREGASCHIYKEASSTRQHWAALVRDGPDVKGTYQLVPVCAGGASLALAQEGGGPRSSSSPAKLERAEPDKRAQAVWVHDTGGVQRLFADCSGMALDRLYATVDEGGAVQFHSNGYADGEWDNESHCWRLEDARFSTKDGEAFELSGASEDGVVAVGAALVVPDAAETFSLGGEGESQGAALDYRWAVREVEADADADAVELPEVVGRACLEGARWLSGQPGVNLIGTKGLGGALHALELAVEGDDVGISARASSGGAWRDASVVGGAMDGLAMELAADARRRYRLRYRCWTEGAGWSGWASDADELSPGGAICGVQAFIEPQGVLEQARGRSLVVDEGMRGKHVTCHVFATTSIEGVRYRGSAASQAVEVVDPFVTVRYFADGSKQPCWSERVEEGSTYVVSPEAARAGLKPGCSEFDGWYVDASFEQGFEDGTVLDDGALDLFGRSVAQVGYELTESARKLIESRECYADEQLERRVDEQELLPGALKVAYGTTISFPRRESIWFEDRGRSREATSIPGAFGDERQSGAATMSLKVTSDVVVYLGWRMPGYEGIWVS